MTAIKKNISAPLINYNDLQYKHIKTPVSKDTLDLAAYKVYKALKTLKLETPFHKETMMHFDEYVYHVKHKLLTTNHYTHLNQYNKSVLNMMHQLDNAAQKQNYKNYKAAMFELDNLDEKTIRNGLLQLIGIHSKYQQKTIKSKNISFDNFTDRLRLIGHPPIHRNKLKIIDTLMRQFDNDSLLTNIDFEDSHEDKDIFTGLIDHQKIIVRTPKIKTLYDLKLFLGELSKAIFIFYRIGESEISNLRVGKLRALSTMVEHMISDLVCTKTEKYFITQIQMLQNSYYATLALYEFDLLDNRNNPAELFKDILNSVYPVKDSDIWGPAIEHNGHIMMSHYVPIGYIMYQNLKTIQKTEKLRKKHVGKWLKETVLTRFKDIGLESLI